MPAPVSPSDGLPSRSGVQAPVDETVIRVRRLVDGAGLDGQLTSGILQEIEDHLREQIAEYQAAGQSEEQAVEHVLADLGDFGLIVQAYHRGQRQKRNRQIRRWTMRSALGIAAAVGFMALVLPLHHGLSVVPTTPAVEAASAGMALAGLHGTSALLASALPFTIHAAADGVPAQVNHQGLVSVNGTRFTGTGQFRFALVDPDSGLNVWTNDGSNVGGMGSPTNPVSLAVADGLYAVTLGDTALGNMTSLSSELFADDNLKLRVWFNDGTNGVQQLAPDHALSSSPYAFTAARATSLTLDTNAAVGRVLTSDASGNGSWQVGGKIIQTQFVSYPGEFSSSSYDTQNLIVQGSITPQRADSKIIVMAMANSVDNGGAGRVIFWVRQNTTSGGTTGTDVAVGAVAQNSTGTSGLSNLTMAGSVTPGTTTTRYFKLIAQKGDAGGSWYVSRYGAPSYMLLMEVIP